MSRTKRALAVSATLLLASPLALAHEREFTLSRDWFLPMQGESEVESRTFFDTTHGITTQEFEYEYGVTDWFGIEPGIEFTNADGNFELDGADLELRFHFGTFAYDKFLPALNVEYEHPKNNDEPDHGELKFIVSRYGQDGQDYTVNLNGGKELTSGGQNDSEITFGYVRPFHDVDASSSAYFRSEPRWGVEAEHDFHEDFNRVGPLFVFRGTEHLNMLASYVFALNERGDNVDQLSLILEWEF
jgi:hypothetical protein